MDVVLNSANAGGVVSAVTIVDVNGIEILVVVLLYNRSTDDIALSLAPNMPPHKVVSRSANGVAVDEHNLLFVAPSCALNIILLTS